MRGPMGGPGAMSTEKAKDFKGTLGKILKYMGAAYLFYMAYGSLKEKQPVVEQPAETTIPEKSFFQLMRKGFLMNVLNPKVSLFFIAFLPQFVSKTGFHYQSFSLLSGIE